MPELPEVEILVRHLAPLLSGKRIHSVQVRRARVIRPGSESALNRALTGSTFTTTTRRGKYILFNLRQPNRKSVTLVGHLGMTGRMYLAPSAQTLPKHAAVVINLGKYNLIFEDTRYFGRLILDDSSIEHLGPEPFGRDFTPRHLASALSRSNQSIKIKLLDQSLVAGIGNIYASESLFDAKISPLLPAKNLNPRQIRHLHRSIRKVLQRAIRFGSTVPLDYSGKSPRNRLFYYGSSEKARRHHAERLLVYDRAGKPCPRCATPIRRIVQAARSTFFCPHCQK